MPPNRGQQKSAQAANQHRRIFRGRGGPTDGNLPPKKATRIKVKYEHNQEANDVQQPSLDGDNVDNLEGRDVNVNQLSLNDNEFDNNSDDEDGKEVNNNPLHSEIQHVQKRIQNITLSIQSSPLGISNPTTWRTNCLHPIKKNVKEWRSILSFHSDEIRERVLIDGVDSHGNSNTTAIDMELKQLLHDAATQVFILIQMALQTGPLVGSNPGYFKRCGGEVASVALEFLTHVIEVAGVDESSVDDGNTVAGNDDDNDVEEKTDDYHDDSVDVGNSSNNNNFEFSDSDVDSDGDDSSSSSNSIESNSGDGEQGNAADNTTSKPSQSSSTQTKQNLIIQSLQRNLLFTEKQAQKIHQWHRNAQKAALANKAPSKSATKLQGQKSKKQRMKDLKMERKLKKKNKGRGRK